MTSKQRFRDQWEKALRGADITLPARGVAFALSTYANNDGTNAYPGEKRLAEDCGVNVSTVRRRLIELVDAGYLTRTSGDPTSRRKGLADVYCLAIPSSRDRVDRASVRGDDRASVRGRPRADEGGQTAQNWIADRAESGPTTAHRRADTNPYTNPEHHSDASRRRGIAARAADDEPIPLFREDRPLVPQVLRAVADRLGLSLPWQPSDGTWERAAEQVQRGRRARDVYLEALASERAARAAA